MNDLMKAAITASAALAIFLTLGWAANKALAGSDFDRKTYRCFGFWLAAHWHHHDLIEREDAISNAATLASHAGGGAGSSNDETLIPRLKEGSGDFIAYWIPKVASKDISEEIQVSSENNKCMLYLLSISE